VVVQGNAPFKLTDPVGAETFIPDVGKGIAQASSLRPIIANAIAELTKTTKSSTMVKVLLGLGAAAVLGGVALIALSKPMTTRELRGAPRRRRKKR
jgi:hypothetical protein